jgi:hypothetical protein
MSCGCEQILVPCSDTGCPIQLDSACVLYHKANSEISTLTNLGIANGATLELILETIDAALASLRISTWTLPTLRSNHTINTLQQFAESADTEIGLLKTSVTALQAASSTPITPIDTQSVDITVSGTNNHSIQAAVKVSAVAGNRFSIQSDGGYVASQTLSVDYNAKSLSISNGNTVSLTSLLSTVDGFLGTFSTDPSAVLEGQYWYNSTDSKLKIKVNSLVKQISLI